MVQKRYIIIGATLIMLLLAGSTLWMRSGPVGGPEVIPLVSGATLFREEIVYACGNRAVRHQGPAPAEILGLDVSGVRDRFPEAEGWTVVNNLPDELVVIQQSGTFCVDHISYRHLALYGNHVGVFHGPLGGGGELLRVEEVRVDGLPQFYRRQLSQAAVFGEQSPEVRQELRRELEFADEESLHAALENLDELQRD